MNADERMTNYIQIIKSTRFNRGEIARHLSHTHDYSTTAWFQAEYDILSQKLSDTCYRLWILERLVARR